MKISVIIVTLNRSKFLKHCLKSLVKQSFPPSEVIIVDNGPDKKTKDVVFSFKDKLPITYKIEKKTDVSVARNTGIKEASGDILAFTDDDCKVGKNWIKNIVMLHQKKPFIIIGGKTLNGYKNNLLCRLWEKVYILWFNCVNILSGQINNYYEFPSNNCIVKTLFTNNISYNRKILKKNEFKPNSSMNEDAELHYKLRALGNRILYSPKLVVYHFYRNRIFSMCKALYNSGKGLFLIKKNKIYNSILELSFTKKLFFTLRLLNFPIYLFKKKLYIESLLIIPFFTIKEIIILAGFHSKLFKN